MQNPLKNRPFFKWYCKNTRNKIRACFIFFLLSLGYSLLHRPVGLIIWDDFRYKKEQTTILEIKSVMSADEEKFLQLYYDNNIVNQRIEIQKEILNYIDNLGSDLIFSTIFGMDEAYLQALLNKTRLFILDYVGFDYAYKVYKNIPYTSQDLQSFNEFLNAFDKVISLTTKLSNEYSEYEKYVGQATMFQAFYINHFTNLAILTQEQICSLDITSLLEKLARAKQAYDTIVGPKFQNDLEMQTEIQKATHNIQNRIDVLKEQLNVC